MRTKHVHHPLANFPVYSAAFISPTELALGGGGGASKTGIKNKVVRTRLALSSSRGTLTRSPETLHGIRGRAETRARVRAAAWRGRGHAHEHAREPERRQQGGRLRRQQPRSRLRKRREPELPPRALRRRGEVVSLRAACTSALSLTRHASISVAATRQTIKSQDSSVYQARRRPLLRARPAHR